ncbi:ABC transporter ATP-binding protein [Actinospongicola halichondriae]|uniref:ABC transporter ATP-binding protein n=1 Tax=Actinospongicola halichondriae TaxID=3236844 RepID=UPI003D3AA486
MIHVDGLSKTFGTRAQALDAVHEVSFEIEAGAFVGYAGPNGAGKSTTVKMLTGVLVPSAGTATVAGLVPWKDRRRLNERTGVVFGQRTQLWWDLPLADSYDLIHRLYRTGPDDHRRELSMLVETLGLGSFLDRPVRSLSLGQRMRAELAAAVLPRPEVLFLDEPTIGLDVEAKAAVRDFLEAVNRDRGTTILLTTHDTDDIVRLCERLLIIDHGRIISDGSVDALRERFGDDRRLVVDLVDDVVLQVEGARVDRADGRRRWLSFSTADVAAPEMVARVLRAADVRDLTLEPPDLEDVIRRIYRGDGADGAGPIR